MAFEEIDQIGAERVVAVVSHDERHILDLGKFAIGQSFDEISGIVRRYKLAHRPTDIERRQHDVRGDVREARPHVAQIESDAQPRLYRTSAVQGKSVYVR